MYLNKEITISVNDKTLILPLKNLLRLAMIYLPPVVDNYITMLADKELKIYHVHRAVWDSLRQGILVQLGVTPGDSVAL